MVAVGPTTARSRRAANLYRTATCRSTVKERFPALCSRCHAANSPVDFGDALRHRRHRDSALTAGDDPVNRLAKHSELLPRFNCKEHVIDLPHRRNQRSQSRLALSSDPQSGHASIGGILLLIEVAFLD